MTNPVHRQCHTCQYFTTDPKMICGLLVSFDWPQGWCRFNLFVTDELNTCRSYKPSLAMKRVIELNEWLRPKN